MKRKIDYDDTDNYDEDESHNNGGTNKIKKLWMCDIIDSLGKILEYYRQLDDRLKHVDVSDIINGSMLSRQIVDDYYIDKLTTDVIEELRNSLKIKMNYYVCAEDLVQYKLLYKLNREQLYSKISLCIHKFYAQS